MMNDEHSSEHSDIISRDDGYNPDVVPAMGRTINGHVYTEAQYQQMCAEHPMYYVGVDRNPAGQQVRLSESVKSGVIVSGIEPMETNMATTQHILELRDFIRHEVEKHFAEKGTPGRWNVETIEGHITTRYGRTLASESELIPEYVLARTELSFKVRLEFHAGHTPDTIDCTVLLLSDNSVMITDERYSANSPASRPRRKVSGKGEVTSE